MDGAHHLVKRRRSRGATDRRHDTLVVTIIVAERMNWFRWMVFASAEITNRSLIVDNA